MSDELITTLSQDESERFHQLEVVIEEGKQTFIEVGCAIAEIKQRKLYRDQFKTFEAYCNERWGWTRQNANRILDAAVIVKALPLSTAAQINSVSAAAALKSVPPAIRPAVVAVAATGGAPVTAASIRKSSPPPPKPSQKPPSKSPASSTRGVQDETGLLIPPQLVSLWERSVDIQEVLSYVSALKLRLHNLQKMKHPLCDRAKWREMDADATHIYDLMKLNKPYAVCPTCQGQITAGCTACGETGFVSQFYWDTCVPEKIKEMRLKLKE